MPIKDLAPAHDERHRLDPDRPNVRESVVWVLPLVAQELGLVAYTWVDAHGRAGAAGIAFGPRLASPIFERVDDVPVPDDMGFDDWEAGPMRFGHLEPLRSSRIDYRGARLAMDFTFTSTHRPYAYSSHVEPFPLYYADERLEQSGRVQGTITVDGETLEVDGVGHRDHSWGARVWGGTLHYKWMNFLTDRSSVHVMDLQGYGRTSVRGYVDRDGTTAEILDAAFDYELDDELVHRHLRATFRDDAGRTTSVRMTSSAAELTYPISPHLTLIDVVGAAEVEGVAGVAYAEMTWPPEYLARNLGLGPV